MRVDARHSRGFPPSSLSSSDTSAAVVPSRPGVAPVARRRQPLKLLGKSVPVVLMEYAMPWNFIAEFAPKKDWSGLAVAIRTHFDAEYTKRGGN